MCTKFSEQDINKCKRNIAKLENHKFKSLNNIMQDQHIDLNTMKINFYDNKRYKCRKIIFTKCVQVLQEKYNTQHVRTCTIQELSLNNNTHNKNHVYMIYKYEYNT